MDKTTPNIDALKSKISTLEEQLENAQRDYYSLVNKKNQNLKVLFDNSNDLIIIFKVTGEIHFANETIKKRLNYTEDEITDLKFIEIVREDYRKGVLQNILKSTAEIHHEKFDTVLISKTGKNIYVTGKLTSIFENDELVEYHCVFYDVTERIRAENTQGLYYQIANVIVNESNLDRLYANIYDELSQMLKLKNFQISLKESNGYKQVFFVNEFIEKHDFIFDMDHQLMNYVFERDRSLIIYEDGIKKIVDQKNIRCKDPMPKIWLGVVISTPSKKGVLSICNYQDQSAFNNRDLEVLDYIGGQISLAMERQHKEEKMGTQTATLRAIFDSSTHKIWSLDRKLKFTSFNRNYEKAFEDHYDAKPKIGSAITEIRNIHFSNDHLKFWKDKYKEAFKGKFLNFQAKHKNREGKVIWREIFVSPIFLPNGNIEELSVIANDITEKKKTENDLVASEKKFRSIFKSFQDIYFRCDMTGTLTMISPSVQEVLGVKPEELIDTNVKDYVSNKLQIYRMISRLKKEKRIKNIEGTVLDAKDQRVTFLFNIRMIKKKNGQDEVEGVAKDISQLKKTNEELIRAKNMAERSLKIKEQFLANMSHEIRTPMNGIIGMIDLLASTGLNAEQSDYVETLNKSSNTLLNILDDILDLSKIEAGKVDLKKKPVNLVKTIERVYEIFSQQALSKNNHLRYHVDSNTPKWIFADETRLTQILSNLTSNAIKFNTQKGYINISLRITEKKGKKYWFKVSVKDSGIGIKEEDQKTLFQNFHQLDNSRSKNFSGTGLGLAISKELVKSMDGDVGVLSTPGLGSTFWFTFCAKEIENTEEDETQKSNGFTRQFSEKNPKVLLVEDNAVNRKVAGNILLKSGCRVVQAVDGFDAIEKVSLEDFDLILMDIQMPKMDGIKSAEEIKKLGLDNTPPIIAMTAYSMEEDRERFLKSGLHDYLSKPIKADVLIKKIKDWVESEPTKMPIEDEAAVEQTEELVINQNTLNQLAKFSGQEFIETTLKEFEDEAQLSIENGIKFFNEANYEGLRGELHTLKGNAGTLGIEKVFKQAAAIEKRLKTNNFEDLEVNLKKLRNLFDEFREENKNILIINE
ncbi:MAG: PAS domain S-box protein [Ekhidna sp.]|nr:PAS domain S-box protein [Ekhidna sp.]MBC6410291.1 PAS domain S-box protein [Ekhidna sp.]MBC6425086.1 PAS domain S-box protein [Ekhidna sp.]